MNKEINNIEEAIDYEKEIERTQAENNITLKEFKTWLTSQNLTMKVINRHISNVDLFINDFLCYYDAQPCIAGFNKVGSFLGDWYIRKVMCSSKTGINESAASIKKFYQYLLQCGKIKQENYDFLVWEIKECKSEWLESFEAYMNMDYDI